jgi:hypothetical protein
MLKMSYDFKERQKSRYEVSKNTFISKSTSTETTSPEI